MPADEQRLSLLVGTRDERQVNNPSPVTDYRGSRAPVLIELSRAFVIQNPRQFKPECVWSVVHVILQRLIIHWVLPDTRHLNGQRILMKKAPKIGAFPNVMIARLVGCRAVAEPL